ncbi:MBOAT family O-acyltransferase [Tunicatimonas pelagia]|uniref:MBOAT family O-acyltransferase n=1 Tax=Tunicatimonas pelagia TaxID=931531 RepID=UPI002666FF38|nr:MBOAT family O-acyltransferase [Tunicatimonas pelagia]WKN42333.1 MBOAT family O-acyltransferase [Tunicatimonas pelagia]
MFFNTLDFALFLPIVFAIYWWVLGNRLRAQNVFLIVASYVFYGWWDWRFLFLIAFSSIVDFTIGQLLFRAKRKIYRKFWLFLSIGINLGILGFFKYYNFFVDAFVDAFTLFGKPIEVSTLYIILPVGISFYTFQTLSYTIDIYRNKLQPTKDVVAFFAFVSFFPQLVAGPIERASNLLPQFFKQRTFQYEEAKDGMRQILWGLFKKIVIADNCALFVDQIFSNYSEVSNGALVLGAIFFAFQIYGDFSGYSDIAIGTAKLFGFKLMRNFAYPYFSRDIAEFWRRWHISLSSWFKDYLYIPLGGSRGSVWYKVRNTAIIFVVSGFWHGANWTFIVWGALNALYFLPLLLRQSNRRYLDIAAQDRFLPNTKEAFQILVTFSLTCFAWIFFRSESVTDAFSYIGHMFDWNSFTTDLKFYYLLPLLVLLITVEWVQRHQPHPLQIDQLSPVKRFAIYNLLTLGIIYLNFNSGASFIYFQF